MSLKRKGCTALVDGLAKSELKINRYKSAYDAKPRILIIKLIKED